jgi:hypothetical protein
MRLGPEHTAALGAAVLLGTLALAPVVARAADPTPAPSPTTSPTNANQCPDGPLQKLCQLANAPGNIAGGAVQFGTDQAVVAVTKWVAGGASNLIGEIAKGLDSTAKPDLTQHWFLDHYRTMAYIGALLMLPMLLASILQGVIRQDVGHILKSAFLYVPLAIFVTGIAVTVVGSALDVTDGMTQMVSQGMGGDMQAFLTKVGAVYVPAQIVAAGTPGQTATPLFVLFLGALVTAVGGFLIFIELLIRDAAIYVAVLFLPLVFAGLVWPAAAPWSKRLVETIAAIILSKFVIVAVLSLAAAGLAATGDQGQFQLLLVGSVLFLLAAFAPYTLFRLIPTLETAAIHQFQGVGQRGAASLGAPTSPGAVYSRIMQSGSSDYGTVPIATEGRMVAAGGSASPAAVSGAAGGAGAGAVAAGGAATGGALVAEAGVKAVSAVKDAGGHQVGAPTAMAPANGGGGSRPGPSAPLPSPTDHGSPEV